MHIFLVDTRCECAVSYGGSLQVGLFERLKDGVAPGVGGVDDALGLLRGLVELGHLVLGQLDVLKVRPDPVGRDALGQDDTASLDLVADQDVGRVDVVRLGNLDDDRVLTLRSASRSERAVRLTFIVSSVSRRLEMSE